MEKITFLGRVYSLTVILPWWWIIILAPLIASALEIAWEIWENTDAALEMFRLTSGISGQSVFLFFLHLFISFFACVCMFFVCVFDLER